MAPEADLPYPDVLVVRTGLVNFHVLRDEAASALYLLDSGFIGGVLCLRRALSRRGWGALPIRGVVLTHGHLDHTLNVARLVRGTGAWVVAPRLDAEHCRGQYPYQGPSRVCGALEAMGRKLLRYEKFEVDHWIEDGWICPFWNGELKAVHLPGHTSGHMGFYHARRGLLFSGDLFASFGPLSHPPPPILNSVPENWEATLARIDSLEMQGVLPNHGWRDSPADHLRSLRRLLRRR